jgi:hypothetical protein
MDMKMFIPIYGPFMEGKRIHESDEPFIQKAFDAALVGAIMSTEMIFGFRHAAHLAAVGEGSALSVMNVKRMQNLLRGGPVLATGLVAAGTYGKAITPAADYESDRYGSVRVTPRLLGGFY